MDANKERKLRFALELSELAYQEHAAQHHELGVIHTFYNEFSNTKFLYAKDKLYGTIYICGKGTEFENLSEKEKKEQLNHLKEKVASLESNKDNREWEKARDQDGQVRAVKDLMTDACWWLEDGPVTWGEGVQVHAGFLGAVCPTTIVDPILTALRCDIDDAESCSPVTVVLCGHSLGAATATVLALHIRHNLRDDYLAKCEMELVTFGSPHVGNKKFAEAVRSAVKFIGRYASDMDVVPKLLSAQTFYEYEHVTETSAEMRQNLVEKAATFVSNVAEKKSTDDEYSFMSEGVNNAMEHLLNAHSLKEYHSCILDRQSKVHDLLMKGVDMFYASGFAKAPPCGTENAASDDARKEDSSSIWPSVFNASAKLISALAYRSEPDKKETNNNT